MKRFLLLTFILGILVATLCGCNQNDENSTTNHTSESVSINNDYKSDGDLSTETKIPYSKDSTSENKSNVESKTHSDDSAITGQDKAPNSKSDNKNTNVNSASSSPSNDEVYEAEIDFSELE